MMPSARFGDLEGASVLITGGGSGIGAKLTEGFALQGAKVAFIDIAEEESRALCDTVEKSAGNRPLYLKADLRDIEALRAAVARAIDANGPVTALVNNAARDDRHAAEDVTPESWNIRPANRTCGTSTIGMRLIALSGVDAIAESARPSATPATPHRTTVT